MPAAAVPANEALRLEALRAHRILDSPPELDFDDLTRRAMEICGAPVGLMTFVDKKRQWFKSRFGVEVSETPRDQSICAHALLTPERPLIVPDTALDPRFADNPDVAGGAGYRFYAGVPLRSPEGLGLGTLCVLDHVPRQLSPDQIDGLRAVAHEASVRLGLRRHVPAERRLRTTFGLSLALLLGLAVFFAVQSGRFLSSDQWVLHTAQVIQQIEHTLFMVQAAESSQRGYTASGQETYLSPYEAAVAALPAQLAALRAATSDNPVQQRRCALLADRIDAKLAVMRTRFDERRTLGVAALDPKYLNGRGRQAMADVIATGNEMIAAENDLLRQRAQTRATGLHTAVGIFLGLSAVGVCLLVAGFLLNRRELRRGHTLGGALARANLGLESEVADRRRAQQRLAVQGAVAQIAAQNTALTEAAPLFLQRIGEHLGWEFGELWTVDPATNLLRLSEHWHATAAAAGQGARDAGFLEASLRWTFAKGQGFPGRVWSEGHTIWESRLVESASFLRTKEARQAGLQRAFACPLRSGPDGEVTSVMVFLGREQDAPDGELVATMETLAGQIAQFAERCRAESALRASQTRFTAFIENAPALAYIKDEAGRMLYGNETLLRTFGLRAEQWLGKTDADFWPEATPAIREADRSVLTGGKAIEFNESIPLPDGRTSRWLSYKFPLRDEATGGKLLAGISIDITAREEAEENRRAREEAERASRAKSAFLSRVSHELRTPLNAILGFGQLLQTRSLQEQDAEALEYILKAGKHLLGLVDEVLDLSRTESGELQLTPGNVDAVEAVRECLDLTKQLAHARGITCTLQAADVPATLWCDSRRLRQVLLNLLANAIHYNREAGSVVVRFEPAGTDKLRLVVSDTGPGIRPADMGRLFVPFARLEQEERKVEGVGLGLVVSRRMTEAMGGRLGMQSEYGQGSSFWVELPLSPDPSTSGLELDVDPDILAMLAPESRSDHVPATLP